MKLLFFNWELNRLMNIFLNLINFKFFEVVFNFWILFLSIVRLDIDIKDWNKMVIFFWLIFGGLFGILFLLFLDNKIKIIYILKRFCLFVL